MSFLKGLFDSVIEFYVDDEFCQPITEHELYAIINHTKSLPPPPDRQIYQQTVSNKETAIAIAQTISHHTP